MTLPSSFSLKFSNKLSRSVTMLRYYVLPRHSLLWRERSRVCPFSFHGAFGSLPFAFLGQLRCSSPSAGAPNKNQDNLAGRGTVPKFHAHSAEDSDQEWDKYLPLVRDFCEKAMKASLKPFSSSQEGIFLEISPTSSTSAAESDSSPLFLNAGNSRLPTSLQWVLEEKYKEYACSPENPLFELPTVVNPPSRDKMSVPLSLYVYLEPPPGYHSVPCEFAKAYWCAPDWAARERMWQEHCAQRRLQSGSEDDSGAGGAIDGCHPGNLQSPLFYWEVRVSSTSINYATFVPSVVATSRAAASGSEKHEKSHQQIPVRKWKKQQFGSPYWVPIKLLEYLPFFPTPPSLVSALQGSSLSCSGRPSHESPSQATEAMHTTLQSTTDHSPFTSKLQPFPPKGLLALWKGVFDPGSYLSQDYYYPCEAYPYLKFCFEMRYIIDKCIAGRRSEGTPDPASNGMHANKLLDHQGLIMDTQSRKHGQNVDFTDPESNSRDQIVRHKPSKEDGEKGILSTTVNCSSPAPAHCSYAFPILCPYTVREAIFKKHRIRTLHSWSHAVMCCGKLYTNTSNTVLSCFFDSAISPCHAIPLDECGNIIYAGFSTFRARLIRHTDFVAAKPDTQSCVPNLRAVRRAADIFSSKTSASTDSAWLQRLQELGPQTAYKCLRITSSHLERLYDMNTVLSSAQYRFRSPYWVEVATLCERWGVEVVSGATPLLLYDRFYVNAEETTDASRFNPRTCTPKRIHEVLCEKGLLNCSWVESERLRQEIWRRPTQIKRSVGDDCEGKRASRGDADKPTSTFRAAAASVTSAVDSILSHTGRAAKTAAFLNAEADEINRMCNLWVAKNMVKLAKWTLRPGAVCTTIPNTEVLLATHKKTFFLNSFRLFTDASNPGDTPKGAPTSTLCDVVEVVYAEDIVEREELVWLMRYNPTIYYGHVTAPDEGDEGFLLGKHAVCGFDRAQKGEDSHLGEFPLDAGGNTGSAESELSTTPLKDNPSRSKQHNADVQQLYSRTMRSKYTKQAWEFRLSPFSRLELGLLSLREGYPPKSREIWVTMSFAQNEPGLKLRERSPMEPEAAALEVDLILYTNSTTQCNVSNKKEILINHAEFVWPDDSKKKGLNLTWLSRKV